MSLIPSQAPGQHQLRPGADISSVDDPGSRIFSLDVLRGIALLGILVTSIWEFGGFSFAEQNYYRTGTHGGNYSLLTTVSILFEGKMRALFALVFGAGIILFIQKKHPVVISPADAFIRRQLWLIAFGLVNAFLLLWPGDILFQYGVVGMLLFAFWKLSPRKLWIGAIICLLVYCGKQYWNYTDDRKDHKKFLAVTVLEKKFKSDSTARAIKDSIDRKGDTVLLKETLLKNRLADSLARKNDTLTKKQAEEKGKWEGMVKSLKYDSAQAKTENKAMRSGYGSIWDHLLQRSQNKESHWLYRLGVWDIASMMFAGMALLGIGFFRLRYSATKYFIVGVLLVVAGLALAWFRIHFGNIRLADYGAYISGHALPHNQFFPLERFLLAIGYASLILWLLRVNVFRSLWMGIALLGRMAFTNYLLQTVICTFFFYGYGFGYFGRLNQWELYFMVVEIAIVQLALSVLWLRYYSMGPLEWLWRSLVYRKWLPNKKQISGTPANEE